MIKDNKSSSGKTMTIPRSVIFNALKDAIETKNEDKINELTDVLYSGIELHHVHTYGITDNSKRIDKQHAEIVSAIESMNNGFKNVDKRFDDVNKRFDDVNKRFESVDKRFESMDKHFDSLDKRFNEVIHYMDKRFEDNNHRFIDMNSRFDDMIKRFTVLTWLIGIGFVSINSLVVILKLFG